MKLLTNHKTVLIQCFTSLLMIFGCDQKTLDDRSALLKSDEIQMKAHLTNDAEMLANEIADSLINLSSGEVSLISNLQFENQFAAYFKTVKYNYWHNMQAPIVRIDEGGNSASMYVQKFLDYQLKDAEGSWSDPTYMKYSWSAQYRKFEGSWKMTAISSNKKDISLAEAEEIKTQLGR